ncbi:hypothetical protein [Halorubrum sp. JWXQ-INN 858]|nr:hypothetical protein [Halorubrum sp. JWXQ-INN 858]
MGIGDILSGQELTMRQIGIIIIGWIVLVSLISVLLLLYTRTLL